MSLISSFHVKPELWYISGSSIMMSLSKNNSVSSSCEEITGCVPSPVDQASDLLTDFLTYMCKQCCWSITMFYKFSQGPLSSNWRVLFPTKATLCIHYLPLCHWNGGIQTIKTWKLISSISVSDIDATMLKQSMSYLILAFLCSSW